MIFSIIKTIYKQRITCLNERKYLARPRKAFSGRCFYRN
ncbi:MAG: hypothetical protein [Olavius algarvensis Delta 4 endosymbiont]|nr:MAG: hypothetical protein [Olavius algarvensis Delta 4 endosymbiont]